MCFLSTYNQSSILTKTQIIRFGFWLFDFFFLPKKHKTPNIEHECCVFWPDFGVMCTPNSWSYNFFQPFSTFFLFQTFFSNFTAEINKKLLLLGARSTQKLVKIHNTWAKAIFYNSLLQTGKFKISCEIVKWKTLFGSFFVSQM